MSSIPKNIQEIILKKSIKKTLLNEYDTIIVEQASQMPNSMFSGFFVKSKNEYMNIFFGAHSEKKKVEVNLEYLKS